MIPELSKKDASKYGKRSGVKLKPLRKWCIEGQYVDINAIAERLGNKPGTAYSKLKVAQGMDGPVTWDRLLNITLA